MTNEIFFKLFEQKFHGLENDSNSIGELEKFGTATRQYDLMFECVDSVINSNKASLPERYKLLLTVDKL